MTETTMMDQPHWGGIKALKKKEKKKRSERDKKVGQNFLNSFAISIFTLVFV